MGCNPMVQDGKVVGFICSPTIKDFGRKYQKCIDCKRKRYFWCIYQEWYGWSGTCLTCGAQFDDREWLPKPFEPRWRKKNVKRARKQMKEIARGQL